MSLDAQLLETMNNGNIEEIKSLLDKGANANAKMDLTSGDMPFAVNAIFFAIKEDNKDMVQLFIEYGADVNAQIEFYTHHANYIATYTPILWACRNTDIMELLLKRGAKPDTILTCKNVNNDSIIIESTITSQTDSKALFLHLVYGAELKEANLTIIEQNNNLNHCLIAFEEIKAMPHLSKLVEANVKRDKNAKAIDKYVNSETERQELIREFQNVKEKYGSNEQLSFIPEYLLNIIQDLTHNYKVDKFKIEVIDNLIKQNSKNNNTVAVPSDVSKHIAQFLKGKDTQHAIVCRDINKKVNQNIGATKVTASLLISQLEAVEPLSKRQGLEV